MKNIETQCFLMS